MSNHFVALNAVTFSPRYFLPMIEEEDRPNDYFFGVPALPK